jgi:hypothetical protein
MGPCSKAALILPFGLTTWLPIQAAISPDWKGKIPMKNLILAAFAALSLTAATAPTANARDFHNGSTVEGDAVATRMQQTGAY